MQVPEVLWAYTSQDVLTMEYAPGTKINRAAELDKLGVNRKLLAKRAVESYLQQLLTFGFFHAGGPCWEHASFRTAGSLLILGYIRLLEIKSCPQNAGRRKQPSLLQPRRLVLHSTFCCA